MDKTKKKIKTIGKVTCIILTIGMIITVILGTVCTIAGIGLLIVNATPASEQVNGFIEKGIVSIRNGVSSNETEINEVVVISVDDDALVRGDLKSIADDIKFGNILTDILFNDSSVNIIVIIGVICLLGSFLMIVFTIYAHVMRSIMKPCPE